MIYNPSLPFEQQDEQVKAYIWENVIDQSAAPKTEDQLGRPLTFAFPFRDDASKDYVAVMTNVYQSDRSWALVAQTVEVIKA